MARKPANTLTEGEQRLIEVLWQLGHGTVAQVVEALPKRDRPAFNTVQTMLRIMEQKGYLHHEEAGRTFVYYPVVDRVSASRAALKQVMQRFFNNSAEALAVRLIEDDALSSTELARLKAMIEEAEQ